MILTAFFGISIVSFGQRSNAGSFDVQVNILNIAFNNYSAFAGYNLNNDFTLGGVIGYRNFKVAQPSTGEENTFSGFYIAPEARAYFNSSSRGNDGLYAAGYLKFRNASTSGNALNGTDINGNAVEYDETNTGLSAGINFGRLWSTDIGVTFGAWAGIGYYLFDIKSTTVELQDPDLVISLPALDFRWGLNVGYRF